MFSQDILKYIPCYKFNQDHIELFFGCIRNQGGCNNNPTVRQFQAAYKKLLHTEIRDIKTGNCIPLDAIAILYISSRPEVIINQSTPTSRLFEDDNFEDNNNLDLPYILPDAIELSECSIRIIAYIAGFVVRYLKKNYTL